MTFFVILSVVEGSFLRAAKVEAEILCDAQDDKKTAESKDSGLSSPWNRAVQLSPGQSERSEWQPGYR